MSTYFSTRQEFRDTIKKLNNARIGSLGEYIYECFNKDKGVLYKKHSERTDFVFNGQNVDIKTIRKLNEKFEKIYKYKGERVSGIKYILVEIFSDRIIITDEEKVLDSFDWNNLKKTYNEWKNNRNRKQKQTDNNSLSIYKKRHREVIEDLRFFFRNKGLEARIIYRTTQDGFGKESPDNLIPKVITENKITVFINYNNYETTPRNIKEIVAFIDKDSVSFPYLDNPKLHKAKIDLTKLDDKYKFKSIEALKEKYI
jgi:hypothetical protein